MPMLAVTACVLPVGAAGQPENDPRPRSERLGAPTVALCRARLQDAIELGAVSSSRESELDHLLR